MKISIWLLGLMLVSSEVAMAKNKGVLIEDLTWIEAEKLLKPETIVVIPLGAAAKEHGPHLKLKNDFLIAEYFKNKVVELEDVVVYPTLNYHFYPAFVEYPGSTTMTLETGRDLVVDIVRSIAKHGPKKFYVLNTGISTIRPLEAAVEVLKKDGVTLSFTNLKELLGPIEKALATQEGGTHADELETSLMLVIAPKTVDMKKAVKDYHKSGGVLTRNPDGPGTYSVSGIWGDATLATKAKGEKMAKAYLEGLRKDLAALRK